MTAERFTALRTTRSARATLALGKRLGALLQPGDVVALVGELGAGKTAFVRGLGEGLGLAEGARVASPSYTIVNAYELARPVRGALALMHLDLYRFEPEGSDEALEAVGFAELNEGAIVVVEWPEHAPAALAAATVKVVIEDRGGDERTLVISRVAPAP